MLWHDDIGPDIKVMLGRSILKRLQEDLRDTRHGKQRQSLVYREGEFMSIAEHVEGDPRFPIGGRHTPILTH